VVTYLGSISRKIALDQSDLTVGEWILAGAAMSLTPEQIDAMWMAAAAL